MTDTAAYKQYNLISYILHLLGFFLGITPLIAIIMNYIKRDEMRGTWLESHVDWQIKTFWFSLLGYHRNSDRFCDYFSGLCLACLSTGKRADCLK